MNEIKLILDGESGVSRLEKDAALVLAEYHELWKS